MVLIITYSVCKMPNIVKEQYLLLPLTSIKVIFVETVLGAPYDVLDHWMEYPFSPLTFVHHFCSPFFFLDLVLSYFSGSFYLSSLFPIFRHNFCRKDNIQRKKVQGYRCWLHVTNDTRSSLKYLDNIFYDLTLLNKTREEIFVTVKALFVQLS
jgi:hypothetical protein